MIVEDEIEIRELLTKMLKYEGYQVVSAEDGKEALGILEKEKDIDIILMDINMPQVDGITATKMIRVMGYPAVVVILTAYGDKEIMEEAANAGADDFITKPIDLLLLSARLQFLKRNLPFHKFRLSLTTQIFSQLSMQLDEIEKLIEENNQLTFELVETLYRIVEFRDYETHEHTLRVGWISGRLAEELGLQPSEVTMIQFAAPLHDIGKIGISDSILLKPNKLTHDEFEIVKKHTVIGYEILKTSSSSILNYAANIALYHHEKWDGTGYPNGLKGEEIPLPAAIVSVTDSLDAIVSKRPYKEPRSLNEAFDEIESLRGLWYNPHVVDTLLKMRDEVRCYYLKSCEIL